MTADGYRAFIQELLKDAPAADVARALSRFPPTEGGDNRALAARVAGDLIFTCGTRLVARAAAAHGASVYSYRFDVRAAGDSSPPEWGVGHGADVPFVWDHGDWEDAASGFTADEERLARRIGAAWVSFADSGRPVPAAGGEQGWPRYAQSSDIVAVLRPVPAEQPPGFPTQRGWRRDACDFWDGIIH